jgi:hypothetical protein
MSVSSGPQLVTNGLILHLDVANRKSFVDSGGSQRSLINTANWTIGSGGVTGFAANGGTAESQRLADTDPWGNSTIVWGTFPSGDGGPDGGWEGSSFNIDNTKTYRSSVWVRRTSSTGNGSFYHGLHTNGSGDTLRLSDSSSETNPYWDYRGTNTLTQNQWYLVVGHIFPANTVQTTAHPDSGFWTTGGTKVASNAGNITSDVKFPTNATTAMQRVYHYYCGDTTTRLQFAYPRWDLVDGNEPTIQELLNTPQSRLTDLSGRGNHHMLGGYYIPNSENPRKFTLDGANYGFTRSTQLAGATSACTVVVLYSTTDTQELWVQGQTGAYYVSASASNNYYHGTCGSPTNYVDLATVIRPDSPINYRNGAYHMWEAKNVDLSGWTAYYWFLYGGGWQLAGNVSAVLVYNRVLTAAESAQNYNALRGRYGI